MGGGDGGGGTGPEARVPTTIQISNTLVTLVEAGETRELTFSVRDQDGVPIINPSASFTSDDENVASVDGSGTVTAVGNGRSMVTVASGAARAAATIDVAIGPAPLEEGVSLSGLSGGPGSERRFTIELPAGGGASELLEVRLHRGTGDADLALRFGEEPALFLSDCATLSDPNVAEELDFCSVFGPASGTWHLLVVGQSSFGGASLDARILTTTPLAEGASVSNLSGSAGDLLYYELDVSGAASPPAQQSLAGSTLRISTSGGSGNLDVFATTESRLSSASLETVPCFSHGDGTTEACEVPDPMTGPWRIALLGREAFSGVSLTATLGEPPATGTITVQKTIESSTGGAPDNPANPPLNGFVFDILEAGTQTVAATVVTDAQGNATDNVPVGSYDVVETNSQGLTDQTGAANGVAVTQGQNTNVPWTNRQVAPATGTITVQKTIESSTGGAPDNPANPPLNGFVFDILEAGTQTVAATVVTDAQGNATDNVPVGSYDVVETNSQGLTDQTGAANGVAVTQGQNTNVPWTNRQVAPATVVIVNLIGNPDDFVFQDPQGSSTTTIQAGTTIRWVRVSGPRHTVTPDGHTEWDEAELTSNGQTFEHTFLTPGTFDYLCDPHRDEGTPANGGNGMRGTIIVQ